MKTFTCTICHKTKTEEISATGHHYDDGVITTPATCTTDGVKTYTCTGCGATKTESVPMTDHDWLHHAEEGHNETVVVKEAYDETVVEPRYICNGCGKSFTNTTDVCRHLILANRENPDTPCGNYHEEDVEVKIHHPAETKTVYVVDKKAYDECKHCHKTRESK